MGNLFQICFCLMLMLMPLAPLMYILSSTSKWSFRKQMKLASVTLLFGFILITAFVLVGKPIFQNLGISMVAFKAAASILLFRTGIYMVYNKDSGKGESNSVPLSRLFEVAFIPLAFPLLTGPGSLSYTLILLEKGVSLSCLITAIILCFICIWFFLFFFLRSGRFLLTEARIHKFSLCLGVYLFMIASEIMIGVIRQITC